ncbi:MAG: DUF1289 domain-containing protein [Alphaproteobacteria bacterium]
MKSPCILVCQLDHRTGYCFGCGRTGDEIMRWTSYTDAQRDTIMAGLDERLVRLGMKRDDKIEARKRDAETLAQKQRLK